jgi:hypothetical protein
VNRELVPELENITLLSYGPLTFISAFSEPGFVCAVELPHLSARS